MTDSIDVACEREQLDRDLAIAAAKHSAPDLPACGECYNCQASVPEGFRFCDSVCRNDWSNRKRCEALRG